MFQVDRHRICSLRLHNLAFQVTQDNKARTSTPFYIRNTPSAVCRNIYIYIYIYIYISIYILCACIYICILHVCMSSKIKPFIPQNCSARPEKPSKYGLYPNVGWYIHITLCLSTMTFHCRVAHLHSRRR